MGTRRKQRNALGLALGQFPVLNLDYVLAPLFGTGDVNQQADRVTSARYVKDPGVQTLIRYGRYKAK